MFGWLTRRNDEPELEGPLAEARSEVLNLKDDLREARANADRYKADALSSAKLVADMHAAAVGEVRGPIRGVVEDVQDIATGGMPNPVRVPIPCICGPADDSDRDPCQATTHRASADLTSDTPKEA